MMQGTDKANIPGQIFIQVSIVKCIDPGPGREKIKN